jgi:23S rRNA U2552 (ribose-2'-O)-methylase RlmE/FtsJ
MKYWTLGNHLKLFYIYSGKSPLYDLQVDQIHSNIISDKKKEIDPHHRIWETYKKKANDYEFIYTSNHNKKNVCTLNVVSRSFFKLHEILKDCNIHLKEKETYACLAEGPGGFIQSLVHNSDKNYRIYGITLLSKDKRVPYWSPIISKLKNVTLLTGKDNTGDITVLKNINSFVETIGKKKCKLVTSDGGIDYSGDYNNQELLSYHLLYSEIYLNLHIQKEKGYFIIKIFDIFHYKTMMLLYLLYLCYDSISFMKPNTSRLSNSEKYVICKGYRGKDATSIIRTMHRYFEKKDELSIFLPRSFIKNILEYNRIYTSLQMNSIDKILNMIQVKKESNDIRRRQIALQWCMQYEIPFRNMYMHSVSK